MKRFTIFIALLALATPAFANSYTSMAANSQSTVSRRNQDKILYDTTTTTTTLGLPVYTGFGPAGSATSADVWRVCKNSEAANVTTTQCTDGIWDDRATLTYA